VVIWFWIVKNIYKDSKYWVTTAKGVVGQLDRFSASMEVLGIEYEKYRYRTNKTIIRLERYDREFEEIT